MNVKFELLILFSIILLPFTLATSAGSTHSNNTTINVQQELNASASAGFNFTMQTFASSSASDCLLVQITPCNNNNPSQFVCINSAYYQSYLNQTQRIVKPGVVCPMYEIQGTISCGFESGYCIVTVRSQLTRESNSTNTTASTSTIPPATVPHCQYGYVCANPANGCAVQGAIYSCPLIPSNVNSPISGYASSFHLLWDRFISFLSRLEHSI